MSGNFAIKGGGWVGPLMANAILNFHFDFLTTSLREGSQKYRGGVHLDRGDVKFGRLQSLQLMVHHWWLHLRTNFDSSHQKVLTFPVWHGAPTDPTEEVMILILRKAQIDLLWSKKHNVSNRPLLGQKFHVTCKVPNLLLRCLNAIQCSWSRIWYMGLSVETC